MFTVHCGTVQQDILRYTELLILYYSWSEFYRRKVPHLINSTGIFKSRTEKTFDLLIFNWRETVN